jgi:hypothetical protein
MKSCPTRCARVMCANTAAAPPLGTAADALDGRTAKVVTANASVTTATRERLCNVLMPRSIPC